MNESKNLIKKYIGTAVSSFLGSLFGVVFAMLGAFIIIPMIVFAIAASQRHSGLDSVLPNSILRINLRGQLTEKRRPMSFSVFGDRSIFEDRILGLFELSRAIDRAKNDKRIAGIYLTIRDFDAGWSNVTALRRKLEEFAATGKWIYIYADRLNEMGLYLASAGTQVFMQPSGEVEFNGLAAQEVFIKGLLEKLDLEPLVFRVGKFKSAIEPLTRDQMSAENREQMQTLIGDIWSQVRAATAKAAKVEPARIDQMAANLEIMSAEAAKKAGLIHETAFIDVVEDRLRNLTSVRDEDDLEFVSPGRLLREPPAKKAAEKKIAVIFAEGEIHTGDSGPESIGSDELREEIKEARLDEDVAAIVLRVNSPGGDALASDVIWRELRQSDEEIPVVVSMGDVAASGGYYIAAAGRYVYAETTTVTGSIGVFGIMFNTEKFFKAKTGVAFDRAITHPYADLGSFTRAMKPAESKAIQGEVERVYKRFLDVVQESRGYEERKDLEGIAEGRVWSGLQAKELGLVDELGGLEQAIAKAAEYAELKEYEVEVYPSDTDSIRHLFARFTQDMMVETFGRVARVFGRHLKTAGDLIDLERPSVRARLIFDFDIR